MAKLGCCEEILIEDGYVQFIDNTSGLKYWSKPNNPKYERSFFKK